MKGFSYPYNPEIHAAARGTGLNVSPKAAREVCHALKGMELEKAKNYLERVMDLEQAVPPIVDTPHLNRCFLIEFVDMGSLQYWYMLNMKIGLVDQRWTC